MAEISGEILHPGTAVGEVLVLDQPLSFWGGFDPVTGLIIDQHHPQCGQSAAGKILALPATRGSAGTPAGIAEAIRRGKGPAGLISTGHDMNIVTGLMTAAKLYQIEIPMISIHSDLFETLQSGQKAELTGQGRIIF